MQIEYLLFTLLCLCASLISSVFGMGTALIVLALGSHILPVREALALATVLFTTSTILKSVVFRHSINWRIAATLAFASFPFAYLGASLVTKVPADLLQRLLGLMILAYVVLTRFELVRSFRINQTGLMAGAAAYGFVSGLLGSGNIIKAVLLREMNISKEAFVGAMAATAVLANIAKLSAFTRSGLLNAEQLMPISALILAAIAAVLTGRHLLHKITNHQFENGLQLVLIISASALVLSV